ncbi:MAG: addiction module protein [Verrucomicrobia bacterium]|nr:addiction module protein [Leptolyngbya sp. ES-bin-22]
MAFPSASRVLLAEKLVESLECDTDPQIQAAWTAEAKQRRDGIRGGFVQPIPGEALA